MDGPWQIGHKTADEYGRLASETAKAMKLVDPAIELVVCGSSHPGMPTFPEWEATVLDHTYDHVDYISLHIYYRKPGDDLGTFLASRWRWTEYIRTVVATCDFVKAKKRVQEADQPLVRRVERLVPHARAATRQTAKDACLAGRAAAARGDLHARGRALVGCMLITLLKHADRVKIACIAQLRQRDRPDHDRDRRRALAADDLLPVSARI